MYEFSKVVYKDENGLVYHLTFDAAEASGRQYTVKHIPVYTKPVGKAKENRENAKKMRSLTESEKKQLVRLGEILYRKAVAKGMA